MTWPGSRSVLTRSFRRVTFVTWLDGQPSCPAAGRTPTNTPVAAPLIVNPSSLAPLGQLPAIGQIATAVNAEMPPPVFGAVSVVTDAPPDEITEIPSGIENPTPPGAE